MKAQEASGTTDTRLRFGFRITILGGIFFVVLVMTILAATIVMSTGEANSRHDAVTLFEQAATQVRQRVNARLDRIMNMASLASANTSLSLAPRDSGYTHPALPFLTRMLDDDPWLYSVYTGYPDGSFLMLIRTEEDQRVLDAHKAPPGTRYILRTITGSGKQRVQNWTYLGSGKSVLGTRRDKNPEYDPRERPWYSLSKSSDLTQLSEAYIFNSLKEPGLTASRRLLGGQGVLGVDTTLEELGTWLNEAAPSRKVGILLLDSHLRLLAISDLGLKLPGMSNEPLANISGSVIVGYGQGFQINGETWLRHMSMWNPVPDRQLGLVVVSPLSEFTSYLPGMRTALLLLAGVVLLFAFPAALFISGKIAGMIGSLADDALRVSRLDFTGEFQRYSRILEFDQLGQGFTRMKEALGHRTEVLNFTLEKLERVVELGIAMSAEKDANQLVELILKGAKELTHADGGSLYLKKGDSELEFQIVLNDTLGFAQGGTSGRSINMPPVRLFGADGQPNHHNVVTHAFHTGKTVNIADAYDAEHFDFSGTKAFDGKNNYRSKSFLTVPLRPLGGTVMGALQLINSIDPGTGEIVEFSPEIQRLVEALAAEAATALYNRDLLETQKQLFDALIQFIAGSIDAKSHYTGAHCARVPELALMIAHAATESDHPLLAGFRFETEDDWREFQIGAWLHDCGKVTTPEFVVDKATKLETIYNRIHEIRTRFEVLLRDARVAALEEKLKAPKKQHGAIDERLAVFEKVLQDEFAFVASCNSGDEAMTPDRLARLKEIAGRTWVRHFDQRLGLSWEELERFGEPETLPVTEAVISDKAHHVIPRRDDMDETYKGLGFTLPMPDCLYNHGEVYNLSIGRGTLTAEERFKINEHVMQTIVMLEKLPLPDSLKRIPRYAGTHHENLKGSGYPRRLGPDQLGVPERIMAIADIFEALSSSDRPYKKSKTLSECIHILHQFKKDGHIDPVLFDLFLTSGLYRTYALKNLKPNQIDVVDIAKYLG